MTFYLITGTIAPLFNITDMTRRGHKTYVPFTTVKREVDKVARVRNLGNLEIVDNGPVGDGTWGWYFLHLELDNPPTWMKDRLVSPGTSLLGVDSSGVWRCPGDADPQTANREQEDDEHWLRQKLIYHPLGKLAWKIAQHYHTDLGVGTFVCSGGRCCLVLQGGLPLVEKPSVFTVALAIKISKWWREANATPA